MRASLACAAPPEKTQDPEAATVWMALGHDPVDVATLQARTQLPLPVLTARLAALELDDKVARLADGRFQRRASGASGI